jgi:threonine/homoserine/homoserine lactone efflux protein
MNSLLPVIGVLIAAAITPGPNNVIVMEAGARAGFTAAARMMLAVVAGSLLVLVLVWLGVGGAMAAWPASQTAFGIAGGAYLGLLGIRLLLRGEANANQASSALPMTMLGVTGFQLVNPKGWILVTTAAAAMPQVGDVFTLAILMVLVTGTCLALWAVAGAASARLLSRPGPRRWFDRTMGALLAVSAIGIVADSVSA